MDLHDRVMAAAVGVGGLMFLLGVIVGMGAGERIADPGCYEDEVVIWSGDAHDRCWPVDDLSMLQTIGD